MPQLLYPAIQQLRDLEREFQAHLPSHPQLNPASLCLYGEVLFLLAGLKPCILVSFDIDFAPGLSAQWVSKVWSPWTARQTGSMKEKVDKVSWVKVEGDVKTEGCDFQGWWIGYNKGEVHEPQIQEIFLRTRSSDSLMVTEEIVAKLLAYPVSLPPIERLLKSPVELYEVGYMDVDEDNKDHLIMSYGCIESGFDLVRKHFIEWKGVWEAAGGGRLRCEVRRA
ncbi:hypothetical protein HDU85_004616 [Gaertneriomyces sp. JEL0708]|nr:hypothetical protein HDU85_004616 [Gaertneriomyces sp. JEL0708]